MRRITTALILGHVIGYASTSFAQDVVPVATNDEFIQVLMQSIGGAQGATAIGIAFLIVKLLMKFVGTPWADGLLKNNGAWKLTIYLGLSFASTVLGVVTAGGTIGAALLSGASISALGVLFNQVYKQFFVKKD